jgi:hypothetical protein
MITASEFLKWIEVFHVLTSGGIDTGVVSWNGLTGVVNATADNVLLGTQHLFATDDGGATDNLTGLPTIVALQSEINNINLQDVYNNSGSSPSIALNTSGFFLKDPLANTLFSFFTSDGTHFSSVLSAQTVVSLENLTNNGFTQFDGQSITNYIPINKGVNNANFTFTAQSIIPSNAFSTAGTYQFGFADESSSPSGFFKLNLIDQGIFNTLFYGTGTANSNIPYMGINGQLVVGLPYGSSTNKNAILQLNSNFQGFLPPSLTTSQENILTGILSNGDTGLSWYNNTIDVQTFWDGSAKQQLLAIDKITQGTNMIITKNSDGSVIFASSGGGGPTTQVQGTFTTSSSSTTSVTTSDSPINVASPLYFNVINSVGTNVNTATISGVTTPIIQNTATGGRWGIARFDLTLSFSTSGTNTFLFTVYTNNGASTFFKNMTLTFSSGTNQPFSFSSPLIFLDTNDYVYLTVSCASGSASFSARTFQGSWVDTTVASIPDSNALLQGSNNLWLSQNGGTTYQNISGTLTPGNVVAANTAGGQLIDSGIPVSSLPIFGDWTPTLTNNVGISGSISVIASRYILIGNFMIVTQYLTFTATDSDVEFTTDLPTAINFTSTTKASLMGQSLVTSSGNPTDGIVLTAASIVSTNTIKISSTVAVGSGTKFLQYAAICELS